MLTLTLVQNGIFLGRLAGIPIRLRWSFLLLLGFVFLTAGGLPGVFMVLLTFASVLLHEMGHSLVAQNLGVRIGGIDLHFLGGAAMMVDPPRTARDEMLIAAAGPIVSLALAGLGFGLAAATGVGVLGTLGWINLILGLFNLIPALPMDGGRILRAALANRMSYQRATDVAVTVSRVFVVIFAVGAIVLGHFQLALLAGLLWVMGSAERRMSFATAYRDQPEILPPPPYAPRRTPRYVVYRW
jgi:Zn-dependent protease